MSDNQSSDARETEIDLINKAQQAVSRCNWVVGECAAEWIEKYARGRTDGDFAALVGLSADQVYQRRRVWETFSDVCENYSELKWSHFYIALNWDDAPECLQWAEENQATVAEMRAWRRAVNGEDLTEEPAAFDAWAGDPSVCFVSEEPTEVRDPESFGQSSDLNDREATSTGRQSETAATLNGVARDSGTNGGGYSPFRSGAGSPAPSDVGPEVAVAQKPQLSPELLIKRMTTTLERMNKTITPEMEMEFRKLPQELRNRFTKAVSELSNTAASMI